MQKSTVVQPKKEKIQGNISQKIKSWGKKLFLMFLSVFIALLIGEVIVRMLYKDMVLFPRYHTDATYGDFKIRRIRPNMSFSHTSYDGTFKFKTNNRGFRNDRDVNYQKAKGEIRVLSLGDSHTQGYEVNQHETFSYVTERLLNEKGNVSTVLNMGVSGFSTAEELVLLENEGFKYQPDYVVLGFYANDFEDNMRTNLFEISNDSLITKNHVYVPGVNIQNSIYKYWIFRFLGEHSYLYGFAFNTVWNTYSRRKTKEATGQQTEFAVAGKENSSDYSRHLVTKLIAQMYMTCKQKGVKLIILDIPGFTPDGFPTSSFFNDMLPQVRANCDKFFYYGDLLEEYRKLPMVHLKHGHRHISAASHQLLGQKIAQYILSDIQSKNMAVSFNR